MLSRRSPLTRSLVVVLLFLALLSLARSDASAQGGEWPTLSGAGAEYVSPSGFFQVSLSGQLDLEALRVGEDRWAGLVGGPSADSVPADWPTACADCHGQEMVHPRGKGGTILAHRLRVFADVFVGDHVYALVEARSDRGEAPANRDLAVRIEQAYVRVANANGTVGVQAGRFASPFGSYALRHLTDVDPFLRPPLPYDYRTVMSRTHAPPDGAGFLTWKNWPELFRLGGTPPVWDVPYQFGAMVFGRLGPVDVRAAAVNSAPSSDPEAWRLDGSRLRHPSWVLGARTRVSPALEVGASYDRGPWMDQITVGALQPIQGRTPSFWDYDQEMYSADFALARGPMMLRGEAILDLWELPNIADRAEERLYSAELQWDVAAGCRRRRAPATSTSAHWAGDPAPTPRGPPRTGTRTSIAWRAPSGIGWSAMPESPCRRTGRPRGRRIRSSRVCVRGGRSESPRRAPEPAESGARGLRTRGRRGEARRVPPADRRRPGAGPPACTA